MVWHTGYTFLSIQSLGILCMKFLYMHSRVSSKIRGLTQTLDIYWVPTLHRHFTYIIPFNYCDKPLSLYLHAHWANGSLYSRVGESTGSVSDLNPDFTNSSWVTSGNLLYHLLICKMEIITACLGVAVLTKGDDVNKMLSPMVGK